MPYLGLFSNLLSVSSTEAHAPTDKFFLRSFFVWESWWLLTNAQQFTLQNLDQLQYTSFVAP